MVLAIFVSHPKSLIMRSTPIAEELDISTEWKRHQEEKSSLSVTASTLASVCHGGRRQGCL